MFTRHYAHWPPGLPHTLEVPRASVYANLEASASRHPAKTAIDFYGTKISYAELKRAVDALAGFLQKRCGVRRGDRVLMYLQNSPQFVIAYYAILRADAVVVPVNPMNRTEELRHYVEDARASVVIAGQELFTELAPLRSLRHVLLATYSDYLREPTDLPVPAFVRAPRQAHAAAISWREATEAGLTPGEHLAQPDDLAVMPYTSGTTGKPKGCMHTHASVQATTIPYMYWRGTVEDTVVLSALPMFHVTGMQACMNAPLHTAATLVLLSRWDRECAALQIERAGVTNWSAITTMLVDFLSNPQLERYDLSSLRVLGGGGAAMPEAVARRLEEVIGLPDDEGYFFITDRLKRMINASGFKVWPAEVEAMLYAHPGIQEACVIGAPDGYRGETVKAVIVPRPGAMGELRAEDIIEWARARMAAFKVPRVVEFVAELPKTATGKILWRELQEKENRK